MKKIHLQWWIENSSGGSPNNSTVQTWLNRLTTLGYTHPPSGTITELNTLFDGLSPYLSKAEMIKVYGLNDAGVSQASTVNFVSPTANQTTLASSPVYSINGWKSAGSGSYLNENILINRRAGIEDDVSGLAYVIGTSTTQNAEAAFGSRATGSAFYVCRIFNTGSVANIFPMAGSAVNVAGTNSQGFYSISSVDTTNSIGGKDGTYSSNLAHVTPDQSENIYTCAWQGGGGSSVNNLTKAEVGFRWEGYQLTTTEINAIRTLVVSYFTNLGLI